MKDYKRMTDSETAKLLKNTEGESWDSDNMDAQRYIRLAELEDKIESGEIVDRNAYLDYLMSTKNVSEVTDKEIEFFVKHNAAVRKQAVKEFSDKILSVSKITFSTLTEPRIELSLAEYKQLKKEACEG